MQPRTLVSILTLALGATAQNIVPNGEFHAGPVGWTLTSFNDPAGTTGFGTARVAGQGSVGPWQCFTS